METPKQGRAQKLSASPSAPLPASSCQMLGCSRGSFKRITPHAAAVTTYSALAVEYGKASLIMG